MKDTAFTKKAFLVWVTFGLAVVVPGE